MTDTTINDRMIGTETGLSATRDVSDDGRTLVTAEPGDVITARVATPDDCRTLDLPLWSLVFVITHPNGTETIYPGGESGVVVMCGSEVDES
jgi:hypothetical protein